MLIGEDGAMPWPWLREPLARALQHQRGHALLLQGQAGSGVLAFAAVLAQSWLCEASGGTQPACGRCASCRQALSHVHADLWFLMPEQQRREHAWLLPSDKPEADSGKKPSRQIRVDEVRQLIDWAFRTSAQGRGKVAVLSPGESLNLQAANALLKTLEEPPASTRIVITTADAAKLLPTVRSRCQHLRLADPPREDALAWLASQGVAEPELLWRAAAGRPLDALALHAAGVTAQGWRALPGLVARGGAGSETVAMLGGSVAQLIDTLLKLSHDALAVHLGAEPRYFVPGTVPRAGSARALQAWAQELQRLARHAAHPWNEPVLVDALLAAAAQALAPGAAAGSARA